MNKILQPKPDANTFLEELGEAEQETLLNLPRGERQKQLAQFLGVSEEKALKHCAEMTHLPLLDNTRIDPWITATAEDQTLPMRIIHEYQALPLSTAILESLEMDNIPPEPLPLLTVWPPDSFMGRWIFAVCGKNPVWILGPADKVTNTITQHFGVGSDSLENSGIGVDEDEVEVDEAEDQNAAIIRFVNEVIQKAIVDRATDIHFEPHRELLQIRYRIDGELVPIRVPDNLIRFQDAIISRLKIMSRLNISEKRRPQDGRITWSSGQDELDIRLSTFPTLYGESVSLRLLNNKSQPVGVQELGFLERDETIVNASLARPYGIILVTGPTGSGKSTSLTAFIRRINKPERRIITVEDPVEYEVPGVNQTQIKPDIGLNFASALRHILRQDPDVIMVGEIRDRETADIAIRASLTGHLVLSTIHTNDAPGALTRLIDMEIEPFLIASSVELIIAQRLVRRVCPHCARPANLAPGYLESCLRALHVDREEAVHADKVLEAVGCEHCRSLGYLGRVGIFELLKVSDSIHRLIVEKASARNIRSQATREGMHTLQQCGWDQIKRGITTLPEVMRFAEMDEDEEKP